MSPPRSRPPLDGKDKRPFRSPARRTEALNANHSAAAPGSDGVRPPLRTVAVTRVLSANSGHCSGHLRRCGDTVGTCDAVRDVLGTAPATVLPTPCTSFVLSPPQEPSNGMGTALGRGPDLDQIKTPVCRTLGIPPRLAQGTVPSTATTTPPTGAARTPTRSPQDPGRLHARRLTLQCGIVYLLQYSATVRPRFGEERRL